MQSSTITKQYSPDILQSTKSSSFRLHRSLNETDIHRKVLNICQQLIKAQGVHSVIAMKAAGFHYTNNTDTVRCNTCGLEVSEWTLNMKPFPIHAQRSPTCPFVCSLLQTERVTTTAATSFTEPISTLNDEEKPSKRQKIEVSQELRQSNILVEVDKLKQIRNRTFSHWPHRTLPSTTQMIEAGFFSCNVGDRVICLYCNLICQQWTPQDDPCEIHKILSPKCSYITAMLTRSQASLIPIINENSTRDNSVISANSNLVELDQIVTTAACHVSYREIPKRYASFATWSNENVPSVDDLVRAGFFYTGTKTIVTCFYCNGSLQNWGANDNPTNEHARWFPHCAYAKQLCGDKQYRRIQESKQRHKERNERNELDHRFGTSFGGSCSRGLDIPNESTLSRLVAARLDLPISQSMLDQNFKLAIIKRCWEDQLRLKRNDFVSDSDLLVACKILQAQILCIDGKKENIIIPSVAMKKICETEQTEILVHEQTTSESVLVDTSNNADVEMSASSETNTSETTRNVSVIDVNKEKDMKSDSANKPVQKGINESSSLSPCALCLTEDKCLACVPCGHVATCVPCGHSLKSCPICRSEIKAFVRVYL